MKHARLLAAAAAFAAVLSGQTQQASIAGAVRDSQGAVLVGVEVTAANEATGYRASSRTNASGYYQLQFLPIGNYVLTVEHPGFAKYMRQGLKLTTGENLALDIEMKLGATTETVTVTGEAPLLSARTSDVSQLIEAKTIEDMPLGDRRSMNMIKILGGAVFVRYDSNGTNSPAFSLAGGRARSQALVIDGGHSDNMRMGIGHIGFDPPVEGMQEVKVLSGNYSAEYGSTAGGVIVASTRTGGNAFHGAAYEYFRNEKLDAANFFAPVRDGRKVRPPLRYNVFGARIGGPVRRDRTFFFFNYEGSRRRDGMTRVLTVPTAEQRMGDFSRTFNAQGQMIPIYDPFTTRTEGGRTLRDPFPANAIPSARRDPVGTNLIPFYPVANQAPSNTTGANNFSSNYVMRLDPDIYLGRVDHMLGAKDSLTYRYMRQWKPTSFTSVFPNPASDVQQDSTLRQQIHYGAWTRTFSPSIVNQFRLSFRQNDFRGFAKSFGQDWPGQIGLKGLPGNGFPVFSAAGYTALGQGTLENLLSPVRILQFVDNLSWVHGSHAFKLGGELRRSSVDIAGSGAPNLSFNVLSTGLPGTANSGNGFAALLAGVPFSFSINQSQPSRRYMYYSSLFVQDDWSVAPSLTLNLGVRWEMDSPLRDAYNRMNSFDMEAVNPVSGTPGVVKFAGLTGWPENPYNPDRNNFGPRVGFAWRPAWFVNTVVRGGYGIFFTHPFDGNAQGAAQLGFSLNASLSSPDNGITAPFLLRDGVPGVTLQSPKLDDSFGAVRVGQDPNTSVTFFERNRRSGYSQQMNLSVQREFAGSTLVEAGYAGNLSRKLSSDSLSLNQIHPSILGPSTANQRFRPYPQFNNVSLIFPTLGVSSYHAGIIRVEKRFSKGVNLLSTYTYAKFLNNTNDVGSAGGTLGAEGGPYSDFYNRRADWGPSENDIRHQFTISSVYELPFGKGKPFLANHPARWVAGDWAVSTVSSVRGGPPFTVGTQANTTGAFSAGSLRADVLRNPNLPVGERTVGRWFDTGAFQQPAQYRFGNQGVNLLRADGMINFDFSILRNFPLSEDRKVQFRAELFNAFNHPNFGVPGRVYGAPGFGQVNSAESARSIQLGLRFVF